VKNLSEIYLKSVLKRNILGESAVSDALHPCRKSSLFLRLFKEFFRNSEWNASIRLLSWLRPFSRRSRITKLFWMEFIKAFPKFLNTFF